ncbi:hypothetical protein PR048_009686 [Dryococelus australis]|uniref:Uncharacterized protein n=1 Tax=Dryococelus australis TaxID=614101 RepID=A0ABQ9I0N8_9NEOP|nr:hypothetical protein PR048_009686 [Dryococelus australis]
MIGFDRSVNYSHAVQRQFLVVSSDSDSDDVLVLTSPERERPVAASHELLVPLNRNDNAVAGSSHQATTNYEHAMEQLARRMVEHDAALNSDHSTVDLEVNDSSDSDCMIVGVVKPRHERTPEIITLPSDDERRQRADDIPRHVSQSFDLMSSSESSLSSQTSDSDYSPLKGHSKCKKKRKTRKGRKETKVTVKEKPKKSQRSSHRSHKSTSSESKLKKFKIIKQLFSGSSSSLSSSSTSSSSDEELHSKKKSKRIKKLSHYKGTWHVKMRGTSYDDDETHRDHNYMINHNPPYTKEEVDDMQLQIPRSQPKLKSIVITRTFTDASPSVSGSSSHHQSRASSSKHSHSHRSSHKRSKHDKKRIGKSDKRRSRFSSDLCTSKTKSRRLSELLSSDSDSYS